jgi:hypothetical protein
MDVGFLIVVGLFSWWAFLERPNAPEVKRLAEHLGLASVTGRRFAGFVDGRIVRMSTKAKRTFVQREGGEVRTYSYTDRRVQVEVNVDVHDDLGLKAAFFVTDDDPAFHVRWETLGPDYERIAAFGPGTREAVAHFLDVDLHLHRGQLSVRMPLAQGTDALAEMARGLVALADSLEREARRHKLAVLEDETDPAAWARAFVVLGHHEPEAAYIAATRLLDDPDDDDLLDALTARPDAVIAASWLLHDRGAADAIGPLRAAQDAHPRLATEIESTVAAIQSRLKRTGGGLSLQQDDRGRLSQAGAEGRLSES